MKMIGCALVVTLAQGSWAAKADSVALVSGDGFGRTEVKVLAQKVFDQELPDVDYHLSGEFLPAEEFKNFNMVVLAGSNAERPYTPEESAMIDDYVQNGGRLLLIQQAPKNLRFLEGGIDRDNAYLYGRSYFRRDGIDCIVNVPEDPLLEGVFEETDRPFWLNASVLLRNDAGNWIALLGHEDYLLAGYREVGAGRLYYLGHETFRILGQTGQEHEADVRSWVRLLKNFIRAQ
jgi:hypothetical protein